MDTWSRATEPRYVCVCMCLWVCTCVYFFLLCLTARNFLQNQISVFVHSDMWTQDSCIFTVYTEKSFLGMLRLQIILNNLCCLSPRCLVCFHVSGMRVNNWFIGSSYMPGSECFTNILPLEPFPQPYKVLYNYLSERSWNNT